MFSIGVRDSQQRTIPGTNRDCVETARRQRPKRLFARLYSSLAGLRSRDRRQPGTEAAELWRPPEGPRAFRRWSRAFALGGGGGRDSSWSIRTDREKFQTA